MNSAAKFIKETIALRDTIEGAYITLGERLWNIKNDDLWKGIYESYGEFLADMRVSEATANKLMQVYHVYIVDHGCKPEQLAKIGWSNLYTAIPLLKNQDVGTVIEKAGSLRRQDLEDEVREEESECTKHKWLTVTIRVCDDCGKRERIS